LFGHWLILAVRRNVHVVKIALFEQDDGLALYSLFCLLVFLAGVRVLRLRVIRSCTGLNLHVFGGVQAYPE